MTGLSHPIDRPARWRPRRAALAIAILLSGALLAGCSSRSSAPGSGSDRGGTLVASIRSEPDTFNRYASRSFVTDIISRLTQAKLVRINRVTDQIEPRLADSWTRSDDGRRYTLHLRPGVEFSDGQPFTSADVLFSFQAAYDPRTAGPLGDSMKVDGKPLEVTAPDPSTVVITFPSVFAPGLRLLDNLPILPKHLLAGALAQGTFTQAWGTSTPPAQMAGLGPFVLSSYEPGQRLVFTRNPHFWLKDVSGAPLPLLERLILEIVPDQNAELLRLESGQIDMTTTAVRPEDYRALKRAADQGKVKLLDLGVGLNADSFWINLNRASKRSDPRAAWLQSADFRRAISYAVDRKQFADAVYLGEGVPVYGPVSPGNRTWYWKDTPETPYDPARAKALLARLGLHDRPGSAQLVDAAGRPVQFTLLTFKGNTALERGAEVIRDALAKVGVTVNVVGLDVGGLVQRFTSNDYDAVYFSVYETDTDPALNPDFWFSSGSAHLWNIGEKTPATPWEAQIDELMARQIAAPDLAIRQTLFDQVQRIFDEHLPVLRFVAPRIYVAMSTRVVRATPSVQSPYLLWNPEVLAVTGAGPAR
ncbi:MAG: ABC transporter substrate-binding protein [Acidobacteriota bacterium]|nr:ABC transporter substrate-binding protein [Acidobacteriota bacterium]